MRTTLTIDDDVLAAAKALATQQSKTIGEIVSELARQSLQRPITRQHRNGVPLLPVSNPKAVVTLEIVNALRDEFP
jgi:Arc/MetJ family transcription regulator